MASNSIVYKNALSLRDCERLYMDHQSADVMFVFHENGQTSENVPAHKSILSISPIFESMFYGSTSPTGGIHIDGTTSEAFKEFLQFFYLSTVRLTAKNFFSVMDLVEKYAIDDCVNDYSEISDLKITFDNICWGYELAILFEHADLEQFCEQYISKHPDEIFRSSSFLHCEPNTLRRILQLHRLECDEVMVFDGCMAWAKNACIQMGMDETDMQNIRYQLRDIFYGIRFGDMAVEDFYNRYCFYKELFTLNEFEDIISMIALKDNYKSNIFNTNSRSSRSTPNQSVAIAEAKENKQSHKSVKISSF